MVIGVMPPGLQAKLHRFLDQQLVRQALQRANNNQSKAARLLRISRDQLRYRMEKFDLLKP